MFDPILSDGGEMKQKALLTSLLFLVGFLISSPSFAFDHQHRIFDQLLQEAVVIKGSQSRIKYGLIQKQPELLNQYVQQIEGVSKALYQEWSKDEQLAFLINAYNALTLKLILTQYPDLESIKDIGGFFSSPWKQKFFTLLGQKRHLDYIEHEKIRVDFKEPRIHFALVCAAISCPPLKNEAFTAKRLDLQLDAAARNFLQDPQRNRFNPSKKQLELSSIFKWFKKDFVAVKGSVEAFVGPYITSDPSALQMILNQQVKLDFLDYDWSLNLAEEMN